MFPSPIFFRTVILFCAVSLITIFPAGGQTEDGTTQDKIETIVCVRQGLNRALRLPQVLIAKFGKPDFIFAPDPNQVNHDPAGDFCYVRPLATIEPTAIQCSLPVNTHFGFTDIAGLEQELSKPAYAGAIVFVAWEHKYLDDFVKDTVKSSGGDASKVPGWQGNDFDSIFVVRLVHNKRGTIVTFTRDTEGLDHLSTDCPNSIAP
jgi:hypothetical protein